MYETQYAKCSHKRSGICRVLDIETDLRDESSIGRLHIITEAHDFEAFNSGSPRVQLRSYSCPYLGIKLVF